MNKIDPIFEEYLEMRNKLPLYRRAREALNIAEVNQEIMTAQEVVKEQVYYYNQMYEFYLSKVFTDGLDWNDYQSMLAIHKALHTIQVDVYCNWVIKQKDESKATRDFFNEIEDIIRHYQTLLNELHNTFSTGGLSSFFQKECSITHLVFTNNTHPKIKPYAEAGYMFLCQFHNEKSPSFGIRNDIGVAHCFGCGVNFNIVRYIEEYENLTYREAVSLLACVYKITIKKHNLYNENDPLVLKYRKTLLSDEYKNLLLTGKERTQKRFLLDDAMKVTRSYSNAVQKFEHDLATIERVKAGDYIKYPGKKPVKSNRLILEMPK